MLSILITVFSVLLFISSMTLLFAEDLVSRYRDVFIKIHILLMVVTAIVATLGLVV